MKKPTLTYDQLRRILALCVDNGVIKAKLEDLLAGALVNMRSKNSLSAMMRAFNDV